jgi:pyrophosphate--fructose-6-phosphate 1-phosphotransferase
MLNTEIGHIFTKCSNIQLNSTELRSKLTILGRAFLDSLPEFIQETLLLSREPETHIRDCKVETEKILAHFVEIELQDRKRKGTYKGSFSSVCSFLGYQGRGAAPSNFDRKYAYNLGFAATKLISGGYSGYTASINNLKEDVENWCDFYTNYPFTSDI